MGSVTLRETSYVGEVSNTIEYEFSDSVDFLAWESDRAERLNNAVKSFVGGLDSSFTEEPMVADIQVTKKTKETKH